MHFSNYLSMRDANQIVDSNVNSITLTPTALKQTAKKTFAFLKNRGIKITKKEERGRPKRLSQAEVKNLLAVRKSNLSFYKIASLTGVPKSTIFDYCARHSYDEVSEEEVEDLQLKKAKTMFAIILEKDLDDGINKLALEGLKSKSVAEMERLLRKIDDIVQLHAP